MEIKVRKSRGWSLFGAQKEATMGEIFRYLKNIPLTN